MGAIEDMRDVIKTALQEIEVLDDRVDAAEALAGNAGVRGGTRAVRPLL